MQPIDHRNHRIRLLPVLLAVIALPFANYWNSSTWNGYSLNALFINAIFITFLLALLNFALTRVDKRLALCPSELLLIYMMLAIATGAAGHDTVEMLTQTIGYPYWFGTTENEWPELFFKDLPQWLTVQDRNILEGFYTYEAHFFESPIFETWLRPLLYWSAFLVVLYFCMLCISILLRKQMDAPLSLVLDLPRLGCQMDRAPLRRHRHPRQSRALFRRHHVGGWRDVGTLELLRQHLQPMDPRDSLLVDSGTEAHA